MGVINFTVRTGGRMLNGNWLVVIRGLPGSGKSSIGELMATVPGAVLLEADQLPGRYDCEGQIIYKTEAHEWLYYRIKHYMTLDQPVIIVTGVYHLLEHIKPLKQLADQHDYNFALLKAERSFKSEHHVPGYVMERFKVDWEDWEELE